MELEKQGDINHDKAYLASQGIPDPTHSTMVSNIPSSNISTLLQSQEIAQSYTVSNDPVAPASSATNTSPQGTTSKATDNGKGESKVDGIINSIRLQPGDLSTIAGSILVNKKILCRSYANGHYYLGTVKKQVR